MNVAYIVTCFFSRGPWFDMPIGTEEWKLMRHLFNEHYDNWCAYQWGLVDELSSVST